MTKRGMNRLSWLWARVFRAAPLPAILFAVFYPLNRVGAADSVPSHASDTVTALMEYQETDYSVINWNVSVALQIGAI